MLVFLYWSSCKADNTFCRCLDSELCLTASSGLCNIVFCTDKTYYEYCDSIQFTAVIKNVSDTSILVEDPQSYIDEYAVGRIGNKCVVKIGDDDPAHLFATTRKYKLDPGDSVAYLYFLPLSNEIGPILDIDFIFWGYAYIDELKYITEGEADMIAIDTEIHVLSLASKSFRLNPGHIYVYVGQNVKNINFFYPDKRD